MMNRYRTFREPRRLKPEESLQISFKETLDLMKPRCLYLHIPNEGKRSPREGHILKRMGLTPGAPDWLLIWYSRMLRCKQIGFLEMKSAKGVLSKSQVDFRQKCKANGIRYDIVRAVSDGIDIMKLWGIEFERKLT